MAKHTAASVTHTARAFADQFRHDPNCHPQSGRLYSVAMVAVAHASRGDAEKAGELIDEMRDEMRKGGRR